MAAPVGVVLPTVPSGVPTIPVEVALLVLTLVLLGNVVVPLTALTGDGALAGAEFRRVILGVVTLFSDMVDDQSRMVASWSEVNSTCSSKKLGINEKELSLSVSCPGEDSKSRRAG